MVDRSFKGKIDDDLEELALKLEEKYPPGRCSVHPDISCFHARAADLHFELNRPQRLGWAMAIVSIRS